MSVSVFLFGREFIVFKTTRFRYGSVSGSSVLFTVQESLVGLERRRDITVKRDESGQLTAVPTGQVRHGSAVPSSSDWATVAVAFLVSTFSAMERVDHK